MGGRLLVSWAEVLMASDRPSGIPVHPEDYYTRRLPSAEPPDAGDLCPPHVLAAVSSLCGDPCDLYVALPDPPTSAEPGSEPTWRFFLDDDPEALWEHACRLAFVAADGTIVSHDRMNPPDDLRTAYQRIKVLRPLPPG